MGAFAPARPTMSAVSVQTCRAIRYIYIYIYIQVYIIYIYIYIVNCFGHSVASGRVAAGAIQRRYTCVVELELERHTEHSRTAVVGMGVIMAYVLIDAYNFPRSGGSRSKWVSINSGNSNCGSRS